ncbi:MAG: rRNA maturation RNase YbeY [Sulfurospirillum sp.]
MILIQNETSFEFNDTIIQKIAKKYSEKDIELLIIDSLHMKKLNKNSRGVDATTDVLSFPLESMPHTPLGSIVINSDKVIKVAKEFSHTADEEIALLFIHGILHLLGYDHERDSGEMREKEEEIIKQFSLPKSLIVRTRERV